MGYFNPLLRLPSAQTILALPDSPQKRLLEQLLRELRADADRVAEESWRRRKGIMGAYWRAVSTYARHCAHAFSRATARGAGPVAVPLPSVVFPLGSVVDEEAAGAYYRVDDVRRMLTGASVALPRELEQKGGA